MTSSTIKAMVFLKKYKPKEALVQATQCLFSCRPSQRVYWNEVISKIESNNGKRNYQI